MAVALVLIGMLIFLAAAALFVWALVRKTGWRLMRSLALGALGIVLFIVGVAVGISEEEEKRFTPLPTPASFAGMSFEQLKEMAFSPSYDDLFRNIEQYRGKLVYYRAEVIQVVDEGGGRYVLRANVTEGEYFWEDTVWLRYTGPRLLEGDIIELVGQVVGPITYRSVLGAKVTIPDISVVQARLLPK